MAGGNRREAIGFYIFIIALLSLYLIAYNLLPQASSVGAQEQKQQDAPPEQQEATVKNIDDKNARGAGRRTLEEERLNIIKADIQKEIEEYKKLKKEIEDARKSLDLKNQEKLVKVGKMFESMPPEDAAQKLDKLDEDTAVAILTSIKPKAAGRILALMENEKAASLSKKIIEKGKVEQEKTSR